MKIDSVHAEFMSGNAVSSTTSSHSIVSRDASGDIHAAGVSITGNPGTLFSYSDGTSNVYGGCNSDEPWFGTSSEHDLRLVTHSNERMRIDSTGNIGIGTSSPFEKLDVRGAIIAPVVSYADNQDAPYLIASSTSYTGATTNWGTHGIQHRIKTDSSGTPRITVDDGNGNEVFTIKNGGNIGIGTSNPSAGKLDIFVPDGETGIHIRGGNYGTDNGEAHIRIGGGGVSSSNISHHAMITGGHTSTGSSYLSFSTLLDYGTHGNNPVERMRINQYGNVGIGTASPYGKLGIYTGSTATAGLTIDRHSSGTYRSELYQESDGLAIKVGDGTNAPTENMRITPSTTATPGKLTVGSGTASGSQMFVYAAGDGSTTSNTDLHVTPNGQIIVYGTRPWVTTTNAQGTVDRQCFISLHAGGHQPAIEWARNNGQGTNQKNWLLRQETDDTLYLWHYNGSAWSTPFVFNKDGKLGVGTASPTVKLDVVGGNIGLDYGQAIEVSPSMATSWTSGTTKLIETGWGTGDEVRFFTPGSQSAAQKMVINSNGRVGIGLGNPGNTLDVRGGLAVSYADGNAMIIDGGGTLRRHYIHNSVDYGAGLHFTSSAIWATDYVGGYSNGGIDWGSSSYRWNNIYTEYLNATGGTIYCDPNTSTTGSPTNTGVYVYNSGTGDACVAVRVKDLNAGDPYISFDVDSDAGWSIGMDNSDSNKFKLANSWSHLTTNTRLTVTTDGKFGIGITNPDVPLHVTDTTSTSVGDTHRWVTINAVSGGGSYTNKFGSALSDTTGGNYTYSIKTVGAISSPRFIIGSDERIKKDIVDVEDDEALVKLRMLHPKKYRFIDESTRGAHQIYGFLANEVKEVLPDAIVEHPEEVPSIYQFANATSSNVITFSGDFNTSQLESNVLVVVGVDQLRHKLTVDEIIDSTSVRVAEDLSAVSGSLDEHGNVVTETQTLSITPEEYDELEDKDGFKPIFDESNVVSKYTKTTTTYIGDQLFVYGEVVDDFKHLQESAISTLSTSALQEVDRQLQAEKARNDALESRVEELEGMVSLIKHNMTWPDA